jgi:hypothetical protein
MLRAAIKLALSQVRLCWQPVLVSLILNLLLYTMLTVEVHTHSQSRVLHSNTHLITKGIRFILWSLQFGYRAFYLGDSVYPNHLLELQGSHRIRTVPHNSQTYLNR